MTRLVLPLALLALTTAATEAAEIPLFNAVCGESVEVHADERGPIYIDGEAVTPKAVGEDTFEVTRKGTTVSVTVFDDSSLEVRYSDPEGKSGPCRLSNF